MKLSMLCFGEKMIRLLQYILSGCFHKWETIDKGPFTWKNDWSEGSGTRYALRCEKCGEIKKKDIK
jgi:hypothetical protein